ncbi:MAG: cupredoxin domain-containing protein [Gemmatimonadales bacterium]|nr:cupredoxin domain-containing protein [Gemmatimonadales bacterium]NIN10960.1 cupredoxin domain-containing protein [Gemmatimonadales bacterium]NIN49553.1 cupredoxin domain-containing protein [Gemmatimonadales bacterium]NIP07017.1 cupredoxin domain-containing protein [Gemmatimonadales bacterium]NIR01650.1 cupredoxin domain-containing protein [Gemmatimonadales bacterium]
MTTADIVVIALGAVLTIGELWFFLGPRKTTEHVAPKGGVQEVRVVVRAGYDPSTIFVEAGRPVRLLFYRDETADCSERVVFEGFGVDKELPAFETTPIQFTPKEPGDYPFRCGTSVLKGRVVAQIGRDGARANLGKGHAKHG